jgi:hypothetical protein
MTTLEAGYTLDRRRLDRAVARIGMATLILLQRRLSRSRRCSNINR